MPLGIYCTECGRVRGMTHFTITDHTPDLDQVKSEKLKEQIIKQAKNAVAYRQIPKDADDKTVDRMKVELRHRTNNGVPRRSLADIQGRSSDVVDADQEYKPYNHIKDEPDNDAYRMMRRPVSPPGEHGEVRTPIDPEDKKAGLIAIGVVAVSAAIMVLISRLQDSFQKAHDERSALQRQQQIYNNQASINQQFDTSTLDGATKAHLIDAEMWDRYIRYQDIVTDWNTDQY